MKRSKKFKKPNLRKLRYSNDGVVGIVVAVLLIGLLVSVVSLIQYQYVPKWMEEKEAEHMNDVLTQFSQLKFAIDTQSASNQTDTPIATSITLGSKELPYLMSMRSYGRLEIISGACKIIIKDENGDIIGSVPLGIIRYTSANAYFIPEEKQSYVYEAGAIITNQTKGSSISIKPSFKPIESEGAAINQKINFSVVNISGVGDKVSMGGYDTVPIQTEFFINTSNNYSQHIPKAKNLTIETSYPTAWYVFLNSALSEYDGTYTIQSTGDSVTVEFTDVYPYPDINLKVIDIFGQIGPGWVE